MKHLNEFLNEAKGPFKATDKVIYHVPDLKEPNEDLGDDFYEKSDEDRAIDLMLYYSMITKQEVKKLKIENIKKSPNGNLEFDLVSQWKNLATLLSDAMMDFDIEELIDGGQIKKA
jgi:hypothetical protein